MEQDCSERLCKSRARRRTTWSIGRKSNLRRRGLYSSKKFVCIFDGDLMCLPQRNGPLSHLSPPVGEITSVFVSIIGQAAMGFSRATRLLRRSPFSFTLLRIENPTTSGTLYGHTSLLHTTESPVCSTIFNFDGGFIFSSYGRMGAFHLSYQSLVSISSAREVADLAKGGENRRRNDEESRKVSLSWIDEYLPKFMRPYAHLAQLDKPIEFALDTSLRGGCWSITLAAPLGNLPNLNMLSIFGCGALPLRGADCTVNDLLDHDIDTKCTRLRPIASGLLTPFQGLTFLGLQLFLRLGILLQLNNYSRVLGASSLLLVFSYPLMKRLTFWPQAYLGLTFNWGALLGWSAIQGSLDPAVVLPLYFSGVCWTLVYDTIYAHKDKEDDLRVGVKSTAFRFGSHIKHWIIGFGIACVSSLGLSSYNAELAWPYYVSLTAVGAQLGWQIWTVDMSNRADYNKNQWWSKTLSSNFASQEQDKEQLGAWVGLGMGKSCLQRRGLYSSRKFICIFDVDLLCLPQRNGPLSHLSPLGESQDQRIFGVQEIPRKSNAPHPNKDNIFKSGRFTGAVKIIDLGSHPKIGEGKQRKAEKHNQKPSRKEVSSANSSNTKVIKTKQTDEENGAREQRKARTVSIKVQGEENFTTYRAGQASNHIPIGLSNYARVSTHRRAKEKGGRRSNLVALENPIAARPMTDTKTQVISPTLLFKVSPMLY
ncbi:hypothetical protein H6P81_003420 [Aristolochia fimbriata]|uniref:4-hydroxybenzoate polyprenyltransferase, mitochondrial n=1 Tax=Aristolochia fimbriata TaxID=158543 RepID=A0AAV7FGL1_ARIFI|nr:hypothetical protein H6P81_003420 [Aristolochia fimbriata]